LALVARGVLWYTTAPRAFRRDPEVTMSDQRMRNCFAWFVGAIFGLSWLMYLGHG